MNCAQVCVYAWLVYAPPEPAALLRGAIESRYAVHSGRIEFKRIEEMTGEPLANESTLSVEFRGPARTWREHRTVLSVKDEPGKEGEAEKKLKAMNNDREAFVKAGYGKWHHAYIRNAFDGNQLVYTWGDKSAIYADPASGIPDVIVDPRGLGILENLGGVTTTLEQYLRPDEGGWKNLGQDMRAGVQVWHLSGSPFRDAKVKLEIWIEGREPFRIHECARTSQYFSGRITSEFDPKDPNCPLPKKIVMEKVLHKETNRILKNTFLATEMKLDCDVDPDVGTLASLRLEPGSSVTDERLKRGIGYWNGTGLSSDFTEARKLGQARLQAQLDAEAAVRWRWQLGSVAAALLLFLLAFRYRSLKPLFQRGKA